MRSTATCTTVLYDGSCPICSREIEQYKKVIRMVKFAGLMCQARILYYLLGKAHKRLCNDFMS